MLAAASPMLVSAYFAPAPVVQRAAAAPKMAFIDTLCAATTPLRTPRARSHRPALSAWAACAPPSPRDVGERRADSFWPDRPRLCLRRRCLVACGARREGTGEETGGEIWDPLDIAGSVGDEALMWFRASELKHGRVAMCADRAAQPASMLPARNAAHK
jgi:hypothetical protein